MDVENHLNQSLDDIIRGKTSSKQGKRNARAGNSRQKSAQAKSAVAKGKQPGRAGNALGVKRSGVKKASGGQPSGKKANRVVIPVNRRTKGLRKGGTITRVNSVLPSSTKGARNQNASKGQKRKGSSTQQVAGKLSDLRITIRNDRVMQQAQYPTHAAPQPVVYQNQAQAGYGPRNMAVREEGVTVRARPSAASIPMRRQPSSDYGVSRRVFGSGAVQQQAQLVRRSHKDFDRPDKNGSYMRMDVR